VVVLLRNRLRSFCGDPLGHVREGVPMRDTILACAFILFLVVLFGADILFEAVKVIAFFRIAFG
jgi:hypothetical protein